MTCDWGDCDKLAVASRWDESARQMLPVCEKHSLKIVDESLWCEGATCPSGPGLHWRTDSCTETKEK